MAGAFRYLGVAALLCLCGGNVFARARTSGYCTQGGQVVIGPGASRSITQVQQSYPQCAVTIFYTGNASGNVSTAGTAVTWVNGNYFNANSGWVGLTITIANVPYVISAVSSPTSITLSSSAGTQLSASYSMPPTAPVAIFSDNSGTVKGNSFTASTTGYWFFYADNGTYDIRASGGGIPAPITWGAVSVIDSISSIPNWISYNPLAGTADSQCTGAANAGLTLVVSQVMTALSTQTMACNMEFKSGGRVQPNGPSGPGAPSAQTVTLTGTVIAPVASQIFDISLGGVIALSAKCCAALYPQWWGAVQDGSTDDSAATSAMLTAAKGAGIEVAVLGGNLRVNTATAGVILSILNGSIGMTIRGAGSELTTISTTTASADLMAAISVSSANPIYNISGIKFVGPDAASSPIPCNTTQNSGNGLRVSGAATALVRLRDVYFTGFCGSGKAGLYFDDVENFSIDGMTSNFNDIGVLFTTVVALESLGSVNNTNLSQNKSYGFKGMGGQNIAFTNFGVQSNYKTGMYLKAWTTSTFAGLHMENNNTSADGSSHGIYFDGSSGSQISGNVFNAASFNGPRDDIYMIGVGNGIFSNVFNGGISNSGPTPLVIEDGASGTPAIGGNIFNGLMVPTRVSHINGANSLDTFCGLPDTRPIIMTGCTVPNMMLTPVTVANLPVAAYAGYALAAVSDATTPAIGNSVVGGGSATALVWNDGTRGWLVFAK